MKEKQPIAKLSSKEQHLGLKNYKKSKQKKNGKRKVSKNK